MSCLCKPNVYRQVTASSSEIHVALVVLISSLAVSVLASLAVVFLVRRLGLVRVLGYLDFNSVPLLDAVCDSVDVGLFFELRLAQVVAFDASLVVHADIVAVAGVLADRDGNDHALPAARVTFIVVAYEPPDDIGVVGTDGAEILVLFEEGVVELVFLKFVGDLVVETGEHGPRAGRLLSSLAWHDGSIAGCFWVVSWLALVSPGSRSLAAQLT